MFELPYEATDAAVPRASLVLSVGAAGNRTALWMGGARALRGDEIAVPALAGHWLVDAAGDMPHAHRGAAAQLIHCVFADSEERPPNLPRIEEMASRLAVAAASEGGPGRIYIVCSQGLNRSGLITGLLLRELGFGGSEAIELIRAARPGALANHAYEEILRR